MIINIARLYPDVADVEGKSVLTKIDSGRRCNNNLMISERLHNLGIYLYPGVPSITSVSQERGQAYRNFKPVFHSNLINVVLDHLEFCKPINFPPHLVDLLTYGRQDPMTGIDRYQHAY